MPTTDTRRSEAAFLGAVINGDSRASDHGLRASDFTDSFLRDVFSACVQLEAQGKTADLVTLSDVTDLDAVSLIDVASEATGMGSLAKQHAENIRSAAARRKISEACIRAAQVAQNPSTPLEDTLAKLRGYLDKQSAKNGSEDVVSGVDAIIDFAGWLEATEPEPAIGTSLPRLDLKLGGGLKAERFYVIGARPGVGKSALMGNMAVHAIKSGKKVLYISLEMGAREIMTRMIASISGVTIGKMEGKLLSDDDQVAVAESYALMPGDNFQFSTMARTPDAIRRAALKMRAKTGLDVVFVDYLQLLQSDSNAARRVDAIGEISRALKLLAMELKIPVVTAAQLNRASANSGDAPKLSELRESGSIEQDADVVLLLHAPNEGQAGVRRTQLSVAKNRQGTCGTCELVFVGETMRFRQEAT